MDISQLIINPRHRSSWSAIDLGFLLARKNYLPLIFSWMLVSFPLFIASQFLPTEYLAISVGIIWWLKPFWDRGPLLIISQLIFAEKMSSKEFLRAYPSLLGKSFFSWLTYKRITVGRSFVQPIIILEGLSGADYNRRVNNLKQNSGSAPSWLTICCAHFELFLMLGIYAFIIMLIPDEVDIDYWKMVEQQSVISLYISNAVTYFCMALIAPFYICAGFMLYINRRILLEGWDVEIQFRLIASRLQQSPSARMPTSLSSVVLVVFLALSPIGVFSNKANADEMLTDKSSASEENISVTEYSLIKTHNIDSAKDAKNLIVKIKNGKNFSHKKTTLLHRLISSEDQDDETDDSWLTKQLKDFLTWLKANIDNPSENSVSDGITFSQIVEILLWLAASLIIIYVTLLCLNWFKANQNKFQFQKRNEIKNKPEMLFGLNVDKNQDTKNISKYTLNLWQEKKYRAALALMYSALLSKLVHHYNFDFREGFTESECANLVYSAEKSSLLARFVKEITQCWLLVAYAHVTPDPSAGERLCKQWSELFDAE